MNETLWQEELFNIPLIFSAEAWDILLGLGLGQIPRLV